MPPIDHSAEYYWLMEGHERALALAARSDYQRNVHLEAAARYGDLARGRSVTIDQGRLQPALSAE